MHGWLLKRKDNTQASSCESKKTKSQVLVDKYKYKSSTSRGQSASSLWRTRVEANLEMGRASLEKTGELSKEQETYFIIPAVSIIINILCHFFLSIRNCKKAKKCTKDMAVNISSDQAGIVTEGAAVTSTATKTGRRRQL